MGIEPTICTLGVRRLIHTAIEEVVKRMVIFKQYKFRIISEELFISWRLKNQIGENDMYVASVLKLLLIDWLFTVLRPAQKYFLF